MKMKKIGALALAAVFGCTALASCGGELTTTPEATSKPTVVNPSTNKTTKKTDAKTSGTTEEEDEEFDFDTVLTYSEFLGVAKGEYVTIESTVQAIYKYSEAYHNTTLYLGDSDGAAYFVYRLSMTQEEYDSICVGDIIKIKAIKSEWSGETEVDCSNGQVKWEVTSVEEDERDLVSVTNLTADFANVDALQAKNNLYVGFNNLKVTKIELPASEGGDIYYEVERGETKYTFCVESDLITVDYNTYQYVLDLQVGDYISVEGFMYWYNGPQLHTMKVYKAGHFSDEQKGDTVLVTGYIQGLFTYSEAYHNTCFYMTDEDGNAYYVYRYSCSKEVYDTLAPGKKVVITAVKSEWSGEVEVDCTKGNCTIDVLEDSKDVFAAEEITQDFNDGLLYNYNNKLVAIKNAVVTEVELPSSEGGDIYYKVQLTKDENKYEYTFCVESDLTSASTECYQKALTLKVGDVLDLEGFMYWYNGPQLHTTKIVISK